MKIKSEYLDWAFIQKSGSGYGSIAEQVDCFTFIESANDLFNQLVKRFEDFPQILTAIDQKPRIALLNQLGRSLYAITSLAKGDSDKNPRTKHAATRIVANFVGNIELACERLKRDWDDITSLFFSPDNVKIKALASIHATGSDSHKGGKQVLILEFATEGDPVRLVYKPADIEVDARIIGRTREIGVKELSLGVPSFAERIADWLGTKDAIPVYRFLPRKFGSRLNGTGALPIRNSYGYIEFLSHVPACNNNLQGDDWQIAEKFDVDASDWIVTGAEQLQRYYRESGRIMAMATVLGLIDLHAGNLIVHKRRPHLIDLEFVCGTDRIGLDRTGLLIHGQPFSAGIGGHIEFELGMDGASPVSSRSYVSTRDDGSRHKLDGSDECSLALSTGFAETMVCLGVHMEEVISFIENELADCIGRVNLFTTAELNKALISAYGQKTEREMPDWREHRDNDPAYAICVTPGGEEGSAKWFASTPQSFHRDIHGLDMPAFYRRLSSTFLLNSEGIPVARDGHLWKDKRSAAQITLDNLKRIKPDWQVIGSPTKALDELICSGLDFIRAECKDQNERTLQYFKTEKGKWVAMR